MQYLGFGLQITVLGMGLVFLLLAVLWGLLTLLLRLDNAPQGGDVDTGPDYGDDEAEYDEDRVEIAPPRGVRVMESIDTNKLAAITIALLQYGLATDKVAAISIAVLRHRAMQPEALAVNNHRSRKGVPTSSWVVMGKLWQYRSWQQWG